MDQMNVTPPSNDISEQRQPMKTCHSGDASSQTEGNPQTAANGLPGPAFLDLRYHVLELLSTKLNPSNLEAYKNRLEALRKCSYYMDVCQDLSPTNQPQPGQQRWSEAILSSSTILRLIDPYKFLRMKKLANSQVRIQLNLLEELYEQICRGRADLESMSDQFAQDGTLRHRVEQLDQALVDFDSTLTPGRLHVKHQLISCPGNTNVPRVLVSLNVKMPVLFDKSRSKALVSHTRLHWYIPGMEPEPGEQFEICHKLVQPTNADEGSQTGKVMCAGNYCVQINNLLPERCYEFTVKRADMRSLVYNLWNDTLVLQMPPARPEGLGPEKKKRRLDRW